MLNPHFTHEGRGWAEKWSALSLLCLPLLGLELPSPHSHTPYTSDLGHHYLTAITQLGDHSHSLLRP